MSKAARFLTLTAVWGFGGLSTQIAPAAAAPRAQADEGPLKVWHSAHFRIEMKTALPQADLARLARVADATANAVKAHPLPLFAPPDGRPRITVFATDAEYTANGGVPGTAGFYQGRGEPRVLIHGGHLARASHEGPTRLPPRLNDDLIVHEIVHLCMHHRNVMLPQWLQEGLAEYFASAHRGDGRFLFTDMDGAIRDHLRVRLSPGNPKIVVARVGSISGLDTRQWITHLSGLPESDRYGAYASALLMTHCFLHGGPQRLETIKSLLTAARSRRGAENPVPPAAGPELETALFRYWQPRGLSPMFSPETTAPLAP